MAQLYRESQQFNQWWVWLILFATLGFGNWAGYHEYMNGGGVTGLVISAVISTLVLILMAVLELRTTVTTDGIEIGFWPFHKKRIFRSEIESARVRKYAPIGEYGGWGYRVGEAGTAYNMMGDQGLQLVLKDGKRILIGTQDPEVLDDLIADYLNDDTTEHLELKVLEKT